MIAVVRLVVVIRVRILRRSVILSSLAFRQFQLERAGKRCRRAERDALLNKDRWSRADYDAFDRLAA